MSHVLTYNAGAPATSMYVSLAPNGSGFIYKAGRIRMTVGPAANDAAPVDGYQVLVKLLRSEVALSGMAPALTLPVASTSSDVFSLSTIAPGFPSIEVGQAHQKGWNPDAQGERYYTHAIIQCQFADLNDLCMVQIEVD